MDEALALRVAGMDDEPKKKDPKLQYAREDEYDDAAEVAELLGG